MAENSPPTIPRLPAPPAAPAAPTVSPTESSSLLDSLSTWFSGEAGRCYIVLLVSGISYLYYWRFFPTYWGFLRVKLANNRFDGSDADSFIDKVLSYLDSFCKNSNGFWSSEGFGRKYDSVSTLAHLEKQGYLSGKVVDTYNAFFKKLFLASDVSSSLESGIGSSYLLSDNVTISELFTKSESLCKFYFNHLNSMIDLYISSSDHILYVDLETLDAFNCFLEALRVWICGG